MRVLKSGMIPGKLNEILRWLPTSIPEPFPPKQVRALGSPSCSQLPFDKLFHQILFEVP